MASAFDALEDFEGAVLADLDFVDALELFGDAEAFADNCIVTPAARVADSHPPKRSSLRAIEIGDGLDGVGESGGDGVASVKPPSGPSMGTSSNFTFCATVIMTCCSLALGARETSQSLLSVFSARWAAS